MTCRWDDQHVWELSIEEGRPMLVALGCGPGCTISDDLGDEREWLAMPPIRVHLRVATDCPAYETDENGVPLGPPKPYSFRNGSHAGTHGQHCDCSRWPCAVPLHPGLAEHGPDDPEPGVALQGGEGVEQVAEHTDSVDPAAPSGNSTLAPSEEDE